MWYLSLFGTFYFVLSKLLFKNAADK